MLSRNDNGVDTDGNNSSVVVLVLNSNLSLCHVSDVTEDSSNSSYLGVRPEPVKSSITASSGHGAVELVGIKQGQGEEFGGLVGCVTEHDTCMVSMTSCRLQVQSSLPWSPAPSFSKASS